MDPNQFNYQQSMFNFMQNFQNPNPQYSQFPSMPTNSAAFFPSSTRNTPPYFFRHQPETLRRIFSVPKLHHMVNHLWNFFVMNRKHRLCLCPKVKFHHFQLKSVLKKKKVALLKKKLERKVGLRRKIAWLLHMHFFAQDEGTPFNLEYAWRLLKDEPKWMGASTENSSKRTKNSASGAHSSSSNLATPSSYEFNSSSPMERPMGQQAAKRKSKAKENASKSPSNVVQETWNKRVAAMERLAQCKEDEMEYKAMQLLSKDTSMMNDSQRDIHEKYCNKLEKNTNFSYDEKM
ncbi:unnamed protein product [Vicia faba]|uniref:No apical meristem-associated C-terminal domain-containing protein n=1 Tax=Vicia faba TaxID=3906 RepID=A0AAV1AVZ0_VICFA|nr:unnamed protein product [Vicia faba]